MAQNTHQSLCLGLLGRVQRGRWGEPQGYCGQGTQAHASSCAGQALTSACLQAGHSLDVVGKHVQPGGCQVAYCSRVPSEVWSQALHQRGGLELLQRPHCACKVLRPPVRDVVSVHGSQHYVPHAPLRYRLLAGSQAQHCGAPQKPASSQQSDLANGTMTMSIVRHQRGWQLDNLMPSHDWSTAWIWRPQQQRHTLAVFSGSASSGGSGVLAVLTAQKRQPRVQVSPGTAGSVSKWHCRRLLPTGTHPCSHPTSRNLLMHTAGQSNPASAEDRSQSGLLQGLSQEHSREH